ncbi:MAG: hypothetical protein HC887_12555 [Desulfobacteraceae bacterium]|nr:hypothetical protein [Desulfobacteraceae bacterium]
MEPNRIVEPRVTDQNRVIMMHPQQQQPQAQQQTAINTVLARLVNLAVATLKAESLEKAGNIIVNQVHTIVKAERAVIVPLRGRDRILCISGDLEPTQDNPFAEAVHEVRKLYEDETEPKIISRETVPSETKIPNTEKILDAMGGTQLLWLPIPPPPGKPPLYALWLERWSNRPWTEEEIRLLTHASVFFGQALVPREKPKKTIQKKIKLWLTMGIHVLRTVYPHARAYHRAGSGDAGCAVLCVCAV